MYFYCFFSFKYFDPYDHYAACWVTLRQLQYILLNAPNMENIVKLSKNTISLVVIVILTVSFDKNEAHIFD